MTIQQEYAIKDFESEARKRGQDAKIDWKESNCNESRGSLFGNFGGITLMVYPEGLISIPAICSYGPPKYPTPAIAAASAKELWDRQKKRDDANPKKAQERQGGHLGQILEPDLKCQNEDCPCRRETPEERRKRARGAFNTVRWWETHSRWRLGSVLKE